MTFLLTFRLRTMSINLVRPIEPAEATTPKAFKFAALRALGEQSFYISPQRLMSQNR